MADKRWAVGLIAACAIAGGIVAGLVANRPQAVTLATGTLLAKPRPIPAFELIGKDGAPYTNAAFGGHWTVVFAGFTFCPDVCPTTLNEMKLVRAKLGPVADQVRVLFLSVDPERDTPTQLAKYVAFFDPSFDAATGTIEQIDQLSAAMGFVYAKVPGATPETYTIDHSTALILIDPQGRVAGYLTPPFKPALIAADLTRLVESGLGAAGGAGS